MVSQNDKTQEVVKTCGCHQHEALEWQNDDQKPRYLQARTGPQLEVCHHKTMWNRHALGCQSAYGAALLKSSLSWKPGRAPWGRATALCENHEVKTTAKTGWKPAVGVLQCEEQCETPSETCEATETRWASGTSKRFAWAPVNWMHLE